MALPPIYTVLFYSGVIGGGVNIAAPDGYTLVIMTVSMTGPDIAGWDASIVDRFSDATVMRMSSPGLPPVGTPPQQFADDLMIGETVRGGTHWGWNVHSNASGAEQITVSGFALRGDPPFDTNFGSE